MNIPSLGSFSLPAFINFRCCFVQLTSSLSDPTYFDGFRWLVSMKLTISLHLVIHRSSCVIASCHYTLWITQGLLLFMLQYHRNHLTHHHLHQLRQHPFYLRTLNHAIPVEFHIVQYLILPLPSPTSPTWGTSPTQNSPRIGLGHHRACLSIGSCSAGHRRNRFRG